MRMHNALCVKFLRTFHLKKDEVEVQKYLKMGWSVTGRVAVPPTSLFLFNEYNIKK